MTYDELLNTIRIRSPEFRAADEAYEKAKFEWEAASHEVECILLAEASLEKLGPARAIEQGAFNAYDKLATERALILSNFVREFARPKFRSRR